MNDIRFAYSQNCSTVSFQNEITGCLFDHRTLNGHTSDLWGTPSLRVKNTVQNDSGLTKSRTQSVSWSQEFRMSRANDFAVSDSLTGHCLNSPIAFEAPASSREPSPTRKRCWVGYSASRRCSLGLSLATNPRVRCQHAFSCKSQRFSDRTAFRMVGVSFGTRSGPHW